jgi:hypothetical protein
METQTHLPAGVELQGIWGNCPVQAEGTVDGQQFYFRARGDAWALEIGPEEDWFTDKAWRYQQDYGSWPDAGWMNDDEALIFISKAINRYRNEKQGG